MNLGLSVGSGRYCKSAIVGSRVVVIFLLSYLPTILLRGSQTFSVRSTDCAIAWVTVA